MLSRKNPGGIMKRNLSPLIALIFVAILSFSVSGQTTGSKNGGSKGNNGNVHATGIKVSLPSRKDSTKFVIIGDTGTGTEKQNELADILLRSRATFPYEFVLMLGDNMYGGEKPADYKVKFENVYKPIL